MAQELRALVPLAEDPGAEDPGAEDPGSSPSTHTMTDNHTSLQLQESRCPL